MPRGVLYTYPNCAIQPLVYPYAKKSRVRVGCMVTYRRGAFGVARFDLQGNAKAFKPWSERQCWASRLFLCLKKIKNLRFAVTQKPPAEPAKTEW